MRSTVANERRKGFLIDFDVVAMRRAQLKNVLMHLVPACIFLLVFFLSPSILVVKVISLTLAIISIVMFIAGFELFYYYAVNRAVDNVTVTDDEVYIDENVYSLKDQDIYFRIENGFKFDIGNIAGCFLVVENVGEQTSKRYWIGPRNHFDTAYKRDLLMDEIWEKQADNIEAQVEVPVRYPNAIMAFVAISIPVMIIFFGLMITMFGCIDAAEKGLFYQDVSNDVQSPIPYIFMGVVMFIFGVVYLLRNIANLTSMPRTVTVSDKGIDIDGNLFDYESYPDIKWERVSFVGEFSLFDFYLCVAGRKYWTGNSFTDGAEAASNEVRKAVLRLNPYERERRKNGRR